MQSWEISFLKFLGVSSLGYIIFGIPTIIGILLFDILSLKPLLFIILPIAFISIPVTTAISWLVAKGSNWENTDKSIIAAFSVPGRFFGVFAGGLLGYHYFNTLGGIIFAVLFYVLFLVISYPLGKYLYRKLVPIK